MRWGASVVAILLGAACASGGETTNPGPGSIGSASATASSVGPETGEGDSTDGSESSGGCSGECTPGEMDTRPCAGTCASQARSCDDDCTWSGWGACMDGAGTCSPGASTTCGTCMEQTCGADCEWGACEPVACNFICTHAARNSSEVCDDEGFDMPDGQLFLVCEDGNGGLGYVANNTGPAQEDEIPRCQGWEDNGQNAWDFLDYVHMISCDEAGTYVEITLPAGTASHFGVHDQPDGSGHLTQVCIATLAP